MPHSIDVLIEEHGIPLPELAERSAMSVERIDAIVHGRWTPSPDERRRLAAALGLDVDAVSWGHTMNPRNVRYHRYGMPEDLSPPPPTGVG
jgi:transcriptional regulator with XRE-family HTH domain